MKQCSPLKQGMIVIAFLFALMVPSIAPACAVGPATDLELFSGAWEPASESVLAFELGRGKKDVHIYDFGSPDDSLEIFSESTLSNICFTEVKKEKSSEWYADTVAGGQSLLLGEDPSFGVSFLKDGRRSLEYFLSSMGGGYVLKDKNSTTDIFIHDAKPKPVNTPLPGAALLLGTGLFGLAASRLRTQHT